MKAFKITSSDSQGKDAVEVDIFDGHLSFDIYSVVYGQRTPESLSVFLNLEEAQDFVRHVQARIDFIKAIGVSGSDNLMRQLSSDSQDNGEYEND